MAGWDSSPSGLLAVLDNPKWPVSRACQAVEECILANSDNLRGFFEQCFPTLLKRLFGYDGTSWLNLVARSPKEADAKALLRLLSPGGVLFSAMYSADADGATQFFFPRERLPTHTQMLLATPAGRAALERWPQYARGAIVADAAGRCHIKLGVFQFFLCWFAFYVIKGDGGGALDPLQPRLGGLQTAGLTSSMRKAADLIHLAGRGRESEETRHPYLAALRQFLVELLPRPSSAAPQLPAAATPTKGGASPFFRTPASSAKRQADSASRGATFYSVLLEFWLADGDEPVPAAAGAATPAAASPGAFPMWGTTYDPPSEDLLEALTELVKYATVADSGRQRQPAQGTSPWLPTAQLHTLLPPALAAQRGGGGTASPASAAAAAVPPILAGPSKLGAAAQPQAQAFARRLYRFFRRALTLWPEQRSIKPLLRCLLAYLAPWRTSSAAPQLAPGAAAGAQGSALASHLTAQVTDLVHRVHWADGGKSDGSGSYGPQWEAHVLSNLPFYLTLLPLFLEASVPRVEVRGESAAQDLVNVLGVVEAASDLRDLLQRVERDYNKYAASQPRRADGPYAELLPWLLEQAHDWEVAATANCAGDTPLVRATPTFALFSTGEGGAAHVARYLLDISSHIFKPEVQRRLRSCLEASLPLASLPAAAADAWRAVEEATYDEAVPRLPKSSWRDVQYRGDPMLRPIASFEIGLLVRLLVALSTRLNAALGLSGAWQQQQRRRQGPVGARREGQQGEEDEGGDEPVENRLQEGLLRLRQRGVRVNLRPLADVRNLLWIPVAYVLLLHGLRVLLWLGWAIATGPTDGGGGGGGGGKARLHQPQHYP